MLVKKEKSGLDVVFSHLYFPSRSSFGKEELQESCLLKRQAGILLQLGQGKSFVLCIFLKNLSH